jgi:hypothetical protein
LAGFQVIMYGRFWVFTEVVFLCIPVIRDAARMLIPSSRSDNTSTTRSKETV